METPILGQAYTAKSLNAACNRLVNLYAESCADGGKVAAYLTRWPGRRLLVALGGAIRGLWEFGGYGYAVAGEKLYQIDSNWNKTDLGSIPGAAPVSMSDNGYQLFISTNPDGYIYNSSTGVLSPVSDPDFPGSDMVTYVGGYFVYNQPGTQKFWISSVLDGSTVDALDYASAESNSDQLVAPINSHKELWLFGTKTTEIYYQSATDDFPFQPIQTAMVEVGCSAKLSIVRADNALFWLGRDALGEGIVYRSNGYNGTRISTHAIETEIQGYSTIADARGYVFQLDGHMYYVLTFPTAGKTWAFDMSTQWWSELAGFSGGDLTVHPVTCAMFFGGEVVTGCENGNLCAYDLDAFTNNGETIKWVRSWRGLKSWNEAKRVIWRRLEIMFETGVGLNGEESPQVMVRWSDDGGHTWGNEHFLSLGKIGEYFKRVFMWRLGVTNKRRDRVFEVSGTDPVKIAIVGAEVEVEVCGH